MNKLFYGDNLAVLRRHLKDETVDLCYIDPPFNSKRNYNQIYNNVGKEDRAQAQAFVDTWTWDEQAMRGLDEILNDPSGKFTYQTVQLMAGLDKVLGRGSLFAYVISMTLRIVEIHRVLKPTGSFYLHCDQSASHYLKIVLDAVFCGATGEFQNEIIWKRAETVKGNFGQGTRRLDVNTDTILFYTKNANSLFHQPFKEYTEAYIKQFYKFIEPETNRRYQLISMTGPGGEANGNPYYDVMGVKRYWRYSKEKMQQLIADGLVVQNAPGSVPRKKQYLDKGLGVPVQTLWDDTPALHATSAERLGYPTQKPEALLERIIKTSSNEGDVVLDAYCGCGTTVAVAQRLNRQWIGIDITYQSIALMLKRLEDTYGKDVLTTISLSGMPQDFASAVALANKADDRVRKEFEKWAVLAFSNNRAMINEKKGGDGGIDGRALMLTRNETGEIMVDVLFSVKSDKVITPARIREFYGTIQREKAACGYFLCLYPPNPNIYREARQYGTYTNQLFGQEYPVLEIITAQNILDGERIRIPASQRIDVLKAAEKAKKDTSQLGLF